MNALAKLNIYSDSESEEEKSLEVRLPLPGFLKNSSEKKSPSEEVDHEGKVRNFPHEPGNWVTYIYIPVDSSEISDCLEGLEKFLKPLGWKLGEDFHISLTRTVILRHHWIPDFINSVRNRLKDLSAFRIRLFGLKGYSNEQNTRSFLSLKVSEGEEFLQSIADKLSDCFKEYNLEGVYENPSFHVSLFWHPGNKINEINKHIDMLPQELKNFYFYKEVSQCICTTGNKKFNFHLSE